jgi:hypothetical protein
MFLFLLGLDPDPDWAKMLDPDPDSSQSGSTTLQQVQYKRVGANGATPG